MDAVWRISAGGLKRRGHHLQVISNDAGYLGSASKTGPSGEPVDSENSC